jgi:leader peptidase (prepilin peptidase)/N-methyltransferase
MGLGDAKLVAMIAAWLGLVPTLLVFLLAVTAGALVGIGAAVRRPRGDGPWQTLPLPLGAFLTGAAIFVLFAGQRIIHWYTGLFP